LGYAVTSCKSPREALDAFHKERFSLVLTDQRMQDMDGTRLMEELHARDPHLPVIIMTAFGKVDDAVDAVRKGAFTYLEKPVKPEELALQIKAALRHGRIEERIAKERKIWTRVIESIGAGLILVDANGAVSWISSLAQTILGIPEAGQGRPYTDLFPSGIIPASYNAFDVSPLFQVDPNPSNITTLQPTGGYL
ncbi:MAG: response regulator, partial [Deltaproteobacteria bacterium]